MGSEAELAQIADEIRGCTRCTLAARRTHTVPGEGNVLSDVLLVGEGPGAREDATAARSSGRPGSSSTSCSDPSGGNGVTCSSRTS
jgi:uracil-DNA glycosylase